MNKKHNSQSTSIRYGQFTFTKNAQRKKKLEFIRNLSGLKLKGNQINQLTLTITITSHTMLFVFDFEKFYFREK